MNNDAKSTFLFGLATALSCLALVWVFAGWAIALIAALGCFGTLAACVGAETGGLK